MMKRTFDILAASFGLVVCSPLFLVVSILIKLDSPGPIFFRQIRAGRNFQPFSIYKFRTMVKNAQQKGGQITTGGDLRITRVGYFLRQYKLDELPQLINILKGDMSIVGPRPEVPQYVEMFKDGFERVLTVRPGLTDLASLRYIDEGALLQKAENPEDEYLHNILPEKIRLATVYLEHGCFLFDLVLIVQTLLKLMGIRCTPIEFPGLKDSTTNGTPRWNFGVHQFIFKYRRPFIILLDLALIVLANYLAFWLRFDGNIPGTEQQLFMQMLPWLVLVRGSMLFVFRLNEGLWRYTSVWDLQRIVSGVLASTIVFYGVVHWGFGLISYPRSVFIIDSILLIGFLTGIRLPSRLLRENVRWRKKKRVLVLGAGDAGERIVREMKTSPSYQYEPIGLIDDEPTLVGQRIHGVKVLGTRHDLSKILSTHQPHEVLVALPEPNSSTVREIISGLESFKVPIKKLPNFGEILNGDITIDHIRNIAIEDLLTRPPVGSDLQAVSHLIEGNRIFVSGAGGSIGSELCRQIARFDPAALILYERYENSLYKIVNELTDEGYAPIIHPVIGDITDTVRLHETMKRYCPNIIFHAAAHKHVPLMEQNPGEAIKNNVLGTRTVAEAANWFGVEQFVLISTDKAINPSSVMGATKRVAELVIQYMAGKSRTRFVTVRFGNVLGSNGSVVPRFQDQIKAGGPVTVTHPAVRRYFMLISEAVHLVLQAATLGQQGTTYVLDMGEQIKLVDLARHLIRISGFVPEKEIPITFVGLRPGEKLQEQLVGDDERAKPATVNKILEVQPKQLPDLKFVMQQLTNFEHPDALNEPSLVIEQLRQLVPTFQKPGDTESVRSRSGYRPRSTWEPTPALRKSL